MLAAVRVQPKFGIMAACRGNSYYILVSARTLKAKTVSALACCLEADLLEDAVDDGAAGFVVFESDDSFALTLEKIEVFGEDAVCCSALAAAISSSESKQKKHCD